MDDSRLEVLYLKPKLDGDKKVSAAKRTVKARDQWESSTKDQKPRPNKQNRIKQMLLVSEMKAKQGLATNACWYPGSSVRAMMSSNSGKLIDRSVRMQASKEGFERGITEG